MNDRQDDPDRTGEDEPPIGEAAGEARVPPAGGRDDGASGPTADEAVDGEAIRAEPSIAEQMKEAARHGGLTALVVRRPILAFVFSTLIVVAGLAAYFGVDVRELPDVDRPVITVRTQYDGAAPETMDREVTQTIEGAVARVAGVELDLLVLVARTKRRDRGVHAGHQPQRRRR